MDINQTATEWDRDTMSWYAVAYPADGSTGTSWQANIWTCNYDCNTYPFTL